MKRRYSQKHAAPAGLFLELVNVLLDGWSSTHPNDPADDPFRIFSYQDEDLCRVWREHRAELLAEWQRRGGTGPCFAAQAFDGAPGPYARQLGQEITS